MLSPHFSWHEALYLPSWDREATEEDGLNEEVRGNLIRLFAKLELVRAHFNKALVIHCAYRPEAYNQEVGGAKDSAHKYGMAADFHVQGAGCDEVRNALLNADLLEAWGLRMEDKPGSNWIHLDIREPGPGRRFFKP